jgi:hypothetical protein
VEGDVGTKLILTPYIEAGNIEEARELSAVKGDPIPDDIPSYSGFFTVNKTYNSNLFFWFFPAEVSNSVYVNLHKVWDETRNLKTTTFYFQILPRKKMFPTNTSLKQSIIFVHIIYFCKQDKI